MQYIIRQAKKEECYELAQMINLAGQGPGTCGLDFLGYADTSGKFAQEKLVGKKQTAFDPYSAHQANYVWGPIDVIDKVITRNRGINFTQDKAQSVS